MILRVAIAAILLGGPAAAACTETVAEFRWDAGQARFAVEIADDPGERANGLMFRKRLPASAGMLFIYEHPQPVSFWMKNTLIPLDMVFIGPDGRVNAVHANAVPGDLTPIPGPDGTLMVLEIQGGLAARLGLGEGAELRHPAVDPATALWACGQP
ncbi:DUF192 domain-containing protein [Defluviimonas sp. SAOS-178_SWC]|uniref:DUF192 domain-containing protein n=1 Tax=Defluviimonas sp. SAOS-178_SWC TaxID=3121287 RepID=UPI003221DE30